MMSEGRSEIRPTLFACCAWRVIMCAPDGAEHPSQGVYREIVPPERLVFTNTAVDQDGKVIIAVSDNGNGIPKNITEKIFQPFLTTKPSGQGTGLGLSLSYDIVKTHSGTISVDSRVNEFTEFVITLPV